MPPVETILVDFFKDQPARFRILRGGRLRTYRLSHALARLAVVRLAERHGLGVWWGDFANAYASRRMAKILSGND